METDAGFVSYLNVKNMIRQKCSILILCWNTLSFSFADVQFWHKHK